MSVDATLRDAVRAAVREVLAEVIRTELAPILVELRDALTARGAVNADASEYISTRRAAEIASVQPATIRRWIAEGQLKECRAGRHIRVRLGDLRRCMETVDTPAVIDLETRAREMLRRRVA